ncbi:MAG TPA: hypothetical protein PKM57_13750 [Kiritimatiellia bacterium]|nr:hypothetical protein [Kiritimatiellia bacterium]HPS08220.1 hypothetical protein [Kiritimatiellia bacterium]
MVTKKTISFLFALALAWIVATILILLNIFPLHPKTKTGWALLIALALPVYLIMEVAGSRVFSKENGLRISKSSFSILRVTGGTLIMAIFLVIVMWITKAIMG